jgi:hypothetical protein
VDWFNIDRPWGDERQRSRGFGATLMALAEEARRSSKAQLVVWTWSFQAKDFYHSLGCSESGRTMDHPEGQPRIQFLMRLA